MASAKVEKLIKRMVRQYKADAKKQIKSINEQVAMKVDLLEVFGMHDADKPEDIVKLAMADRAIEAAMESGDSYDIWKAVEDKIELAEEIYDRVGMSDETEAEAVAVT